MCVVAFTVLRPEATSLYHFGRLFVCHSDITVCSLSANRFAEFLLEVKLPYQCARLSVRRRSFGRMAGLSYNFLKGGKEDYRDVPASKNCAIIS